MKKIVVKVGSDVVVKEGKLALRRMAHVCESLGILHASGYRVLLVSSGAIACGKMAVVGYNHASVIDKATAATFGQGDLIRYYKIFFHINNFPVGQLLLSHDQLHDSLLRNHILGMIIRAWESHGIMIANGNDGVNPDEVQLDNDMLARMLAEFVDAQAFIVLSMHQGLYTADPTYAHEADFVATAPHITQEVLAYASSTQSPNGAPGGMRTKLLQIQRATQAGIPCYLAAWNADLLNVLAGKAGTFFPPQEKEVVK